MCICILIFHLIYFIEKILLKSVIKRQGLGFPPATMNVAPGYFSWESRRKIKPKEIPGWLIPRLLVKFTQQLY